MHFNTLFKVLPTFLALVTLVLSAGLPVEGQVGQAFPRSVLTYTGEINGTAYELTGTVTDVLSQLKEKFPDYQPEQVNERSLETRSTILYPPLCIPVAGQPWSFAKVYGIKNAVEYLISYNGEINIGPGPANCGSLYCKRGASVVVCNDNNHGIKLPSTYLAAFADNFISYCLNSRDHSQAGGQQFDSTGFNVFVEGGNC